MTDPLTQFLNAMIAKCEAATPGRRAYLKGIAGERPSVALMDDDGLTRARICSTATERDAALIAAMDPDVAKALVECALAILRDYRADAGCVCANCAALARLQALAEGRTK